MNKKRSGLRTQFITRNAKLGFHPVSRMGKILGLDYGEKYLGVAISDSEKKIAFPRMVLSMERSETVFETLALLCKEEGIERIVIGLPFDLHERERTVGKKIRAFAKKLESKIHIPISWIDESFTTEEARQKLMKKKYEKEKDLIAAQIILERFLASSGDTK